MKTFRLTAVLLCFLLSFGFISTVCSADQATASSVNNPDTALTSDDFSESYMNGGYYKALKNVKLTGDLRKDMVAVAASQVGYCAGENENELNGEMPDSGQSGSYSEYGRFFGKPDALWCSEFASWCARQAGVSVNILANSTAASVTTFGADCYSWNESVFGGGSYTPRPGDLILFAFGDTKTYETYLSHTAIISEDFETGENIKFHIIEGNAGKKVKESAFTTDKKGALTNGKGSVAFFVAPDYEAGFLAEPVKISSKTAAVSLENVSGKPMYINWKVNAYNKNGKAIASESNTILLNNLEKDMITININKKLKGEIQYAMVFVKDANSGETLIVSERFESTVPKGCENLCEGAEIYRFTGSASEAESASNITDGDFKTKWSAEIDDLPQDENTHFFAVNLGKPVTFNTYAMYNAGINENGRYNAASWKLYCYDDSIQDWKALDSVKNNTADKFVQIFTPVTSQYIFVYIYSPDQTGKGTANVYEFELYNDVAEASDEPKLLFGEGWDMLPEGSGEVLEKTFYEVWPRLYARWGNNNISQEIITTAHKDENFVNDFYTFIPAAWTYYGYRRSHQRFEPYIEFSVTNMKRTLNYAYVLSHELTHCVECYYYPNDTQQFEGRWWKEALANYGRFRYYAWADKDNIDPYN